MNNEPLPPADQLIARAREVDEQAAMVVAQHAVVLQRAERALADLQQADANIRRAVAIPPEENLADMDHNALRRELARLERQEGAQWDQMMRITEILAQIRREKRRINAILRPSLWSRLFNRNN